MAKEKKVRKKGLVGPIFLTVISLVLIVGMIIANIVTSQYEQVINLALGTSDFVFTVNDDDATFEVAE